MDGQDSSSFSPLALIALVALGYMIWSFPRRWAVSPLLIMVGLMPMGQQIEIAGLHFYLFRVLLLLGMARVVARGEARRFHWTRIDKFFAWWVVVSVLFGVMSRNRWGDSTPSFELLVNRLGDAFNAIGCYFFVRCVVLDLEDILACVRTLAWVCMPVAALMLVEKLTGHNYLSVFGGVPAETGIRDGSLRCQGAFRTPILAGTFGATAFPMFVALWFREREYRTLASVGAVCAMIIALTASSSGAMIALGGSFLGLGLWFVRTKMRQIRWGVVVAIIICAMCMKQPVWYLIARMSDFVGGGGWHRSFVIDTAVNHFSEWWLFGTTYTAHWGPAGEVIAADTDMMDITNQYVVEGVKGGLLKLGLFVAIIVMCFKVLGRRVKGNEDEPSTRFLFWAMGASLFAHCLSFISVPYFDQMIIIWYWLLATTSSIIQMPGELELEMEEAEDEEGEWMEDHSSAAESPATSS